MGIRMERVGRLLEFRQGLLDVLYDLANKQTRKFPCPIGTTSINGGFSMAIFRLADGMAILL